MQQREIPHEPAVVVLERVLEFKLRLPSDLNDVDANSVGDDQQSDAQDVLRLGQEDQTLHDGHLWFDLTRLDLARIKETGIGQNESIDVPVDSNNGETSHDNERS